MDSITDSSGNVFDDLDCEVCGNCKHHSGEGVDGYGWCNETAFGETRQDFRCHRWAKR